jgi:hypothetical protein
VRAFYERAAEGDLAGSWRLAGPGMRAAFGNSFETFSGDLGSLRAITFDQLEQTGQARATPRPSASRTVAEHTDRTSAAAARSGPCAARRAGGWSSPYGVNVRASERVDLRA